MSDIGIKDVSHVSIGVSDMERSIAFYRDVFGWEQLFDERMEGEAFEALTGVPGAAGQACGGRIGSLRVELMHFNFIPDVPVARPGSASACCRWRSTTRTPPTPSWCAAACRCRGRRSRCSACTCSSCSIPTARASRCASTSPVVRRGEGRTDDRGGRGVRVRRPRRRPHPRARQRPGRTRRCRRCSSSPGWGSTPTSTTGCSTRSATAGS